MPRRRPLSPEQLREIAEAARRPLPSGGWTDAATAMPTDPDPKPEPATPPVAPSDRARTSGKSGRANTDSQSAEELDQAEVLAADLATRPFSALE